VTAVTITVDNGDSGTFSSTGTWTSSTVTTGGLYFGSDFWLHRGSQGSATATWQPNIPIATSYEVSVRHTTGTSRTSAAQFTVNYDGGSQTIPVDQTVNGGQWISIGTFPFAAGTAGSVVLTSDTEPLLFTVADAVRFTESTPTPVRPNTWGRLKSLYR
jgi:hypothetical protein